MSILPHSGIGKDPLKIQWESIKDLHKGAYDFISFHKPYEGLKPSLHLYYLSANSDNHIPKRPDI